MYLKITSCLCGLRTIFTKGFRSDYRQGIVVFVFGVYRLLLSEETRVRRAKKSMGGGLVVNCICISLPMLYRFRRKVFGSEIIDRQVRKEFSLAT